MAYVKKGRRGWSPTPGQIQVIFDYYAAGGSGACLPHLPGITREQVNNAARTLGVSYEGQHVARSKPNTEPTWTVPAHDYTPADFAVREWRTSRTVGDVFAPSMGLRA